MSSSDWDKLSEEQQAQVNRVRERMAQALIKETEAFYKEHPDTNLQLMWNFTCDARVKAMES